MRLANFFSRFIIVFILWGCSSPMNRSFDVSKFKDPPQNVKVHTWWHWIDGRITLEGITKDLESMKAQGIVQATILNIGMSVKDSEVKRVSFNSPKWYKMFQWALQEADRIGITIGVHNCDGWSESGGPWITPEMSMKKFVFTKTRIKKEQKYIRLPQPLCETKFYRDVAVVAFQTHGNQFGSNELPEVSFNDTIDASILCDGSPESMIEIRNGDKISMIFKTKEPKSRIAIMQNFKGAFYFPGPKTIEYTVSTSNDGIHFNKVAQIATNKFYVTDIIKIPKTYARFFEVEVSKIHNLRPWHHAALAEIQLLGVNDHPAYNPTILYPLEKTASARILDTDKLYLTSKNIRDERIISENEIIDLTDKMQPDGTLNWSSSDGNWSVIRFGYTTTGAQNGPATKEGRGLECDKMDTTAVNLHFRNFPQKLIEHAGNYTGNTFKFFMIDSWERGYQTWTNRMPQEFEKRRGYNLTKWIPALCGETVGSTEESEAFLYDFRKTIADLFEQYYYKHFNDLCHRNNLELHGEVIYGDTGPFPPVDVIRTNKYMDLPMYEFWAEKNSENLVENNPTKEKMLNFPVYASNFYNKPVIGAEAYTGHAHYSESPADLKLFGDRAFCSGINQMILHSYVHQPDERKPGLTLGQHGSHFNRHNPWWQFARGWMDYQARAQYILQGSEISSEILYFLGDQLPQFFENRFIDHLPEGYQAVPCNLDVLEQLIVVNGKLRFPDKQSYSLLVLPDRRIMSFKALEQVERLLHEGATVYGEKPGQMLSLHDIRENSDEFGERTDKIWSGYKENESGQNSYGKGRIIWGKSVPSLLTELKLNPDFITHLPDTTNLMFIHKNTKDADVFFVVNQQDKPLSRMCYFNTAYTVPEIWNPETGEVTKIAVYDRKESVVCLPVTFEPKESLFFIFSDESPKEYINKVEEEGKQLFPPLDNGDDTYIPVAYYNANNELQFETKQNGDFEFTSNNRKTYEVHLNAPKVKTIDDFTGNVTIMPVNNNQISSIDITNLKSFIDYSESKIKYFSGTALYQIDFDLPSSYFSDGKSVSLRLGKLDAATEISLNGKSLGYLWMSGMSIPVTGLLKEKNHLEVRLGTTCRNRIIGDLKQYDEVKSLWTSGPVTNFLRKDSSLKPSGLTGPIQLVKYN